jgi:hypothetical protein
MNVALWIIAGVLSVAFLVGAVSKLVIPKDKLAAIPGGGWVEGFSPAGVKALGALDGLAAVGLVVPAALDIAPVLVPVAAVGVALLMIGASIVRLHTHMPRATMAGDMAYFGLAVFLAWGRFGPTPFSG